MNAPAHFTTTFGSTAERLQHPVAPCCDAVPIGWLVDARIRQLRQLRQLIRAGADGQK